MRAPADIEIASSAWLAELLLQAARFARVQVAALVLPRLEPHRETPQLTDVLSHWRAPYVASAVTAVTASKGSSRLLMTFSRK